MKNQAKIVSYLLDNNYETISIDQFMEIIKICISLPNIDGFISQMVLVRSTVTTTLNCKNTKYKQFCAS